MSMFLSDFGLQSQFGNYVHRRERDVPMAFLKMHPMNLDLKENRVLHRKPSTVPEPKQSLHQKSKSQRTHDKMSGFQIADLDGSVSVRGLASRTGSRWG